MLSKQFIIKNLNDLNELSKFLIFFLKPNVFLLLEGELGVGKTKLTQFIGKNLKIKEKITSPTFSILQRYKIRENFYLNHFDFFRIKTWENINFFSDLTFDNINIIEWPENNEKFWKNEEIIKVNIIIENKFRLIKILL